MTTRNVGADFFHHPFLCAGEFERQIVLVEGVEDLTYFRKDHSLRVLGLRKFGFSQLQLKEEQFLELESSSSAFQER